MADRDADRRTGDRADRADDRADQKVGDDARARAALEALRAGRTVPEPGGADGWAAARRTVDRLSELVRARPLSIAGAALAMVLLGSLAWLALRPAGQGAVSDDALFSVPATTPTGEVPGGAAAPATTTTTAPGIVVHAAGAVRSPGVYLLAAGARVADLLDRAGGPTPDTDLDRLNLAAPLADGQRLYVPRRGEEAPAVVGPEGGQGGGPAGATTGPVPSGPIDLNTATAEQLDTLPGVGPATAAAIVDHRQRNGPFASVDALLEVRGIGPAKLDALRELVTVG